MQHLFQSIRILVPHFNPSKICQLRDCAGIIGVVAQLCGSKESSVRSQLRRNRNNQHIFNGFFYHNVRGRPQLYGDAAAIAHCLTQWHGQKVRRLARTIAAASLEFNLLVAHGLRRSLHCEQLRLARILVVLVTKAVEGICTICLDSVEADELVYTVPCKHQFHARCLYTLIGTSEYRCPNCRASLFLV